MTTAWNAGPGELAMDRFEHEDLDEFEELERVNEGLRDTLRDQNARIVSFLGESRKHRATLRQLAQASLAGLPEDDRAQVVAQFGFSSAHANDIPF